MMYKKKRNVASGDVPDFGVIFMSNSVTKKECFRKKLFGLPASMATFVKQVKAGMVLFLFEYESRALYGVYQACTDGGMELSPDAYKSSSNGFPAQVRYEVIWFCRPLSENEFGPVIKDNYFTPKKFNFGLSKDQVRELLVLFSSRKFRDGRPPNRALSSEGPTDAIEGDMYEDDDEVHENDDLMEDHIMVEDVKNPLLKKVGGSNRLIKFPEQTAAQLKSGGRPRLINRAIDGEGLLMDDPTCPTATYKDFSVGKDTIYEFCDSVDNRLTVENATNPLFYSGYPESSISKRRRVGDNGLYGFAPEVVRDGAAITTSGIGIGGRFLTEDAGCNRWSSFSHADDPNMYIRYPRDTSSRMQLEGGLVGADSAVYRDVVDGRGPFVVQDAPLARSLDVPQPFDGTGVKMNLTHDEYQGRIDTNDNNPKGVDHAHSDVLYMDSDDACPYDHGFYSHLVHATGTSHGQNVVDASQDSLLAGLPLSPRRSQLPFRPDVDVGGYSHKAPGYSRNVILQGFPSAGCFEGDNRGLYQSNNFESVSALLARKLPAQAMRGRRVRGLPSHGMSRIHGSSLPNDMYPMMKSNNSHRMESSIGDADYAFFKQGFALKSQSGGHEAPLLEGTASKSPKRTSVFARLNFSDVHGQRDNSQATSGDNGMGNIVDEMMEMLTEHHERIKGSKLTTSENQGENITGLGESQQSQGKMEQPTFPVARKLNVGDTTQDTSLETRKAGPVNLKNQTEVREKHEKSDVEASQKDAPPKMQRKRKKLVRPNFNSKKSDVEREELAGLSPAAEITGVGSGNKEADNVKDQHKCVDVEKPEASAIVTVEPLHHKPHESVISETLTCVEGAQGLPNSDDIGLPSCTDKNDNNEKNSAFVNVPSEANDDAEPDNVSGTDGAGNHERTAVSGDMIIEETDSRTDLGAETSELSNSLLEGSRNDEE